MRTRITGRLVVGFNAGGHASFDGEVVYEDGKIDYYSIDYESPVDRTADATNHVVILGLVNLHYMANTDVEVLGARRELAGVSQMRGALGERGKKS
ncbi:hypothetical protein ABNG02_16275 [Halorubrum ejinorense]|uniref:Uncharacterized protein n=1 Tax=Halorubrum ejinorense TaxID=425309 RepID=A0AAV3STW7_9EURY